MFTYLYQSNLVVEIHSCVYITFYYYLPFTLYHLFIKYLFIRYKLFEITLAMLSVCCPCKSKAPPI